jgi:tRNA-binding protein
MKDLCDFSHFAARDIRIGRITEAQNFEKTKKSTYIPLIDFGSLVIKKSSAKIGDYYTPESLID